MIVLQKVPGSTPYNLEIENVKEFVNKYYVKYDEEGIFIGYLNPINPKTILTKVGYDDHEKLSHVLSAFKAYENNNGAEFKNNINSNIAILYLVRATIYFGDKNLQILNKIVEKKN